MDAEDLTLHHILSHLPYLEFLKRRGRDPSTVKSRLQAISGLLREPKLRSQWDSARTITQILYLGPVPSTPSIWLTLLSMFSSAVIF